MISSFLAYTVKKIKEHIVQKIQYKLFLTLLVISFLPILLFGIISYNMSASSVYNDSVNYKINLNKQIINNIDENINNLSRQSMAVYANLSDILYVLEPPSGNIDKQYMDSYRRVGNYLQSILHGNDRIDNVALISMKGEIKYFVAQQASALNIQNVHDEAWFHETIKLEGFPLLSETNSYMSKNSIHGVQEPVISISRGVMDITGSINKLCGVLVISQNISRFEQLFTDVGIEQNEIFLVLGKSGDIIYTNTELSADLYGKLNELSHSSAFPYFNYKIGDQDMLVTFSESSNYGWKVISLLPVSELQKKSEFLKEISRTLLIFILVAALLLSIIFSSFITSPLKHLMDSFYRLQRGDFDTKISVRGKDELSLIGQTFNNMVDNIRILIKDKYELTLLHKQAELDALQNQINPHFLYNTLTSIKAVVDHGDITHGSLMIQNLSDIFRYNLNTSNPVVDFSLELDHVQKYLFIQHFRFSDKFSVSYDIDKQVLNCKILRLTLQPIVENALYHGLEPKRGKGEIKITAKTYDNKLYIYISDNGVGIGEKELAEINLLLEKTAKAGHGMTPEKLGLYNANARIKYYFGEEYSLKISSGTAKGTTVKIMLPMESNPAKGVEYIEGSDC